MSRISRHHMYMLMAEAAARRSTCFRRAVGAVLVSPGNNVVSIGYNGPPSGEDHCTGKNCPSQQVCTRAVHAEINVFDRCRVPAFVLYVTESPCPQCADRIIHEGVDTVYFMHEYRLREGLNKLIDHGIRVFRLTPSGYIINASNGEMVTT